MLNLAPKRCNRKLDAAQLGLAALGQAKLMIQDNLQSSSCVCWQRLGDARQLRGRSWRFPVNARTNLLVAPRLDYAAELLITLQNARTYRLLGDPQIAVATDNQCVPMIHTCSTMSQATFIRA